MDAKRTLPRLRKALTLELPDGWIADVLDVSAMGLRVITGALLPVGTEFEGTLQGPDSGTQKVQARVVWVKPRENGGFMPLQMGLEVIDSNPGYLETVAKLFSEQE